MITVGVHLSYRFIKITDLGVGMLLSLANALLLVFTLLWGLMGILEFRMLLKAYKNAKNKLYCEGLNTDDFITDIRKYKYKFAINISYLIIILCQSVYVIYNWD